MQLTNTSERFGWISYALHWVMAMLIIFMLCLGIYMTRIPISALKLKLYGLHKEIGILILVLATARLIWRIMNIRPSLENLPRWEKLAAQTVHWLLYLLMIAVPFTGWLVTSAAGLPVSFFDIFLVPTIIAPNTAALEILAETHTWLAYGLGAVICLHMAAALKHHVIDKDDILRRMVWPPSK